MKAILASPVVGSRMGKSAESHEKHHRNGDASPRVMLEEFYEFTEHRREPQAAGVEGR